MNIAMAEQSQIDAYLDRVRRFVEGVHTFQERIRDMLEDRTSPDMAMETSTISASEPVPSYSEPVPAYEEPLTHEPVSKTVSYETPETSFEEAPTTVTADDVDIDALLSDISLDHDISL